MQLNYREYGTPTSGRPSILLLHGLFGSAANWAGIARRLQDRFHLLVPDLRNHGGSPHDERMDFPAMAGDVLELMNTLGLDAPWVVGHSMGAKTAMWLALEQPRRVRGLVAVDMAPVRYPLRFAPLFKTLQALDLGALESRVQADTLLKPDIERRELRTYLLQNLVRHQGRWRWRCNLPVLHRSTLLSNFPEPPPGHQYPGPSLFLYGGRSDYVTPENEPAIRALFPFARLRMIPEAGHWVYSEAPEAFLQALSQFLES